MLLCHSNIPMVGKSTLCLVHSSSVLFCVYCSRGYSTLFIVILLKFTQFLAGMGNTFSFLSLYDNFKLCYMLYYFYQYFYYFGHLFWVINGSTSNFTHVLFIFETFLQLVFSISS